MGDNSLHGLCFKLLGFGFNLEVDEEAGPLENSSLYYLVMAPLPVCLPVGESAKTTFAFS